MPIQFIADVTEFHNMAEWFKRKGPAKFAVANGMLLNNFAFGVREELISTINRDMIQRTPSLTKRMIKVEKNRNFKHISTQVSAVGSIRKNRFSGWGEQQLGTKTKRKRVATIRGRSGSKKKRLKPSARLRKKFFSPRNMPRRRRSGMGHQTPTGADNKVLIMLRTLQSMKYNAPFVITDHSKIPPGVYKFARGKNKWGQRKLELLQGFDPKNKQPRRMLWMSKGVARWFKTHDVNREFMKVARRLITRSTKFR
jgi:hypothetical protein